MTQIRQRPPALYARLPRGPNRLGREEVARNQRARLYGAMIESVSERGYRATTVADVIALAGVSRRAFYEQFANRGQCFEATCDLLARRAHERVLDAWRAERGWANRLEAACRAPLEDIADAPKAARVLLVESLAAGPGVRGRLWRAQLDFERLLARAFAAAPHGAPLMPLAARAVVGGVRQLAVARILERRERELVDAAEEVLDWACAYRSRASLAGRGAFLAPPAPVGPDAREACLHGEDERARALRALVELVFAEGAPSLHDAGIARLAGISTAALHMRLGNAEDCSRAVLDAFAAELLACVDGAMAGARSWPEAVRRGLAALVGLVARERMLSHVAFRDLLDVGPSAMRRMGRCMEDAVRRLAAPGPPPRRGPSIACEAVAGGLLSIIAACVEQGHVERLRGLVDHLAFLVLAPYLGARAAVLAINDPFESVAA
jgi:AcrR family transcriptional regulator